MEWMPIEVAPMEEWILGFWTSGCVEKVLLTNDGEDYMYHTLWDGEQHWKMPTHWMPLPKPPTD